MSNIRSIFLIFLAALMLLTIIGFSLAVPGDTHAHPAYGFTPTPIPTDKPDGGGGGSNPPPLPPEEEKLTDYVLVQLDQCDMECYEDYTRIDQLEIVYPLFASASTDEVPLPFSINTGEFVPAPEIQVPVRLIHQGSGWIADETLSTQRSNKIMVPYPGKWEVFMTGQPRFITADAVNATGTNLAELQAQVATDPVPLGVVEANTAETQMILCPISCVVEPPEEIFYLPETGGAGGMSPITALALSGLALLGMGFLAWIVIKLGPAEQ